MQKMSLNLQTNTEFLDHVYMSVKYYLKINVYNYAFDCFGSAFVSTVTHYLSPCNRRMNNCCIYSFHLTKKLFGSLLLFHLIAKINIIFYYLTTVYVLYMYCICCINSVSVNLLSLWFFF